MARNLVVSTRSQPTDQFCRGMSSSQHYRTSRRPKLLQSSQMRPRSLKTRGGSTHPCHKTNSNFCPSGRCSRGPLKSVISWSPQEMSDSGQFSLIVQNFGQILTVQPCVVHILSQRLARPTASYCKSNCLRRDLGVDHVHLVENQAAPDGKLVEMMQKRFSNDFITYTTSNANAVQGVAYHSCLKQYRERFNWIAFFDIDEYLVVMSRCVLRLWWTTGNGQPSFIVRYVRFTPARITSGCIVHTSVTSLAWWSGPRQTAGQSSLLR